jgi:hypothetical protein
MDGHPRQDPAYGLLPGSPSFQLDEGLLHVRPVIWILPDAPPYAGAGPHFLIEDRLDDRERLTGLIRMTVQELPALKPGKTARRAGPARGAGHIEGS